MLSPHAFTRDVGTFDVYGGWALLKNGPGVTILARTRPTAWVDLNNDGSLEPGDAVQSFAVAVAGQMGAGRFVVFGDDAVFQNRFLTGATVRLQGIWPSGSSTFRRRSFRIREAAGTVRAMPRAPD